MEKLILTDVDGVLFDWLTHFHKWMGYKGHNRVPHTSYWMEHHYPGLSEQEAKRHVNEFNSSGWVLDMPVHDDARSGVAQLVEAGYKFHAITAMDYDPYSQILRQMNLDNIFGKDVFIKLDLVGVSTVSGNKRPALSKYAGTNLPWIEDTAGNAKLGKELGLNSILINAPSNIDRDDGGSQRVNNWKEICELLINTD